MSGLNGKLLPGALLSAIIASLVLLLFYFTIVSLLSGWQFALNQLSKFWYFIITLAFGFGVQVGLFTYLKKSVQDRKASRKVLAASGTTSTVAMISCCAHYLVNVLPIIGVAGLITFVSQYQVQFFWIGLVFNLVAIMYMTNQVYKFSQPITTFISTAYDFTSRKSQRS